MQKKNPILETYIAEMAVKRRYDKKQKIDKNLMNFCKAGDSSIYRAYLIIDRHEIDNIIVDMGVSSLEDIKSKFIRYRYKDGMEFNWIADNLSIGAASLYNWNKEILSNIANLLFYRLTEEDIFHRRKVINMINIIDRRLESLKVAILKGVDVNTSWMETLACRRQKYRKLLDLQQECLKNPEGSKFNEVISLKLMNPQFNVDELHLACPHSPSTVSRQLKKFEQMAASYVG